MAHDIMRSHPISGTGISSLHAHHFRNRSNITECPDQLRE
ncbi:hypothetical protein SRABI128_04412 [Microbacterium sp. Bi128]|nr:hypothetical protein SRABI128_04412 [Microbacterium sp. Bi128]